ncbi:MAG: uroporphyrin-3 C-methyltransferase [Pseudohongiellaceae bacterium]
MAEQPETAKVLEEISKKNTAKSRVKAKGPSSIGSAFLLVFVGLAMLAALGFLAYQMRLSSGEFAAVRSENQRLQQVQEQQTRRLESFDLQVQQLNLQSQVPASVDDSAIAELRTEIENQIASIARIADKVNVVESLQQSVVSSPDFEWKIFEADYLLGIANQKLQLESDISAAAAMMEAADAALLGSGSNRVFAVRQAIANDLTSLRSVDIFDRQGVYLRIGALIEEVENIDLVNSMRENFENNSANDSTRVQPTPTSNELITSSLEFLSTVFVWRQWDQTPNAILASEQGEFIKQNLKLMLEQSQLALLMKDQTVYAQALKKSSDWLERYAVMDSTAGKLISSELVILSSTNINPVLPEISESLTLIRQLTSSER